MKEIAYKAYVRPILEYASSVWDPHTDANIVKLEAVQRRAARFVLQQYHNSSSPSAMLQELHWPSLQTRRRTARLAMLYKVENNLVYAGNIKSRLQPAPLRQRRGHDRQFTIPRSRTIYRQQSFLPRTLKDWNNLPENAVEAKAIDTFVLLASPMDR